MINLDSIFKSRDIALSTKVHFSQGYSFSSSHVWLWELDHKEIWVLKNGCFWTVVLEKSLESPSYCKEIKPIIPNGNQSRILIGRTDAEAETPILWPLDAKNWLLGKDSEAGKDWRQEAKEMREDEIVGWHHEFEQAQWILIWASSRSWWWTRNSGMPQSMRLQRVKHDWATELNPKF